MHCGCRKQKALVVSSEESANVQISTDFLRARAADQSTVWMLTGAKNIRFDSGQRLIGLTPVKYTVYIQQGHWLVHLIRFPFFVYVTPPPLLNVFFSIVHGHRNCKSRNDHKHKCIPFFSGFLLHNYHMKKQSWKNIYTQYVEPNEDKSGCVVSTDLGLYNKNRGIHL